MLKSLKGDNMALCAVWKVTRDLLFPSTAISNGNYQRLLWRVHFCAWNQSISKFWMKRKERKWAVSQPATLLSTLINIHRRLLKQIRKLYSSASARKLLMRDWLGTQSFVSRLSLYLPQAHKGSKVRETGECTSQTISFKRPETINATHQFIALDLEVHAKVHLGPCCLNFTHINQSWVGQSGAPEKKPLSPARTCRP